MIRELAYLLACEQHCSNSKCECRHKPCDGSCRDKDGKPIPVGRRSA